MSSAPMDRLSELPESLVYHIFWLLPMRDVIRTSVLAKRWQKLWTTTPYLNFSGYAIGGTLVSVRNFVNRVLILWRGIKIVKFKIDFGFKPDELFYCDLDVWLRFAKEYEVEELYVHLLSVNDLIRAGCESNEKAYWLIECLYSCSSLKVLSLIGCNLNVHVNLRWNRLKSLTIHGYCLNEYMINKVLWGSPQLEVFILSLREIGENLSIRSSSLKKLSIGKYFSYIDDVVAKDRELTIWSPNLEVLEMSDVPYSKCLLLNVSSLTHATLWFDGNDFVDLSSSSNFLEENLRQILPSIQHVENVTLSDWCIEVLVKMKKKDMVPSFPNVKFLHLNVICEEYKEIVCLLESFPKLERLVIHDEMEIPYHHVPKVFKFDAESYLKFETSLPKSFLLQLRTIEVTWAGGVNSVFPFIEILFEYAINLEKMVFRINRGMPYAPSNFFAWASKKVVRMQRSSLTAELVFPKYYY